jgi:hypothetical protein
MRRACICPSPRRLARWCSSTCPSLVDVARAQSTTHARPQSQETASAAVAAAMPKTASHRARRLSSTTPGGRPRRPSPKRGSRSPSSADDFGRCGASIMRPRLSARTSSRRLIGSARAAARLVQEKSSSELCVTRPAAGATTGPGSHGLLGDFGSAAPSRSSCGARPADSPKSHTQSAATPETANIRAGWSSFMQRAGGQVMTASGPVGAGFIGTSDQLPPWRPWARRVARVALSKSERVWAPSSLSRFPLTFPASLDPGKHAAPCIR